MSNIASLELAHPENQEDLGASVERFAAGLAGEGAFSAPVQIPDKDELTVRLVNLAALQQLDEAQSDVKIFENAFWALCGGTLGTIATQLSSKASIALIDMTTGVVIGGLFAAIVASGLLWRRYARRANARKSKILKVPSANDALY